MNNEESRSRRWVHRTLLVGLVTSALLLAGGCVLLYVTHTSAKEGAAPRLPALVSRAVDGDGQAMVGLGLFILMLTPVARVITLALGWLLNRDWIFAGVAGTVLVLLVISVVLGTG